MQNDHSAEQLDYAFSILTQVKDLLDLGEDELHNADRVRKDGSRNREVDKGHNLVLAAQRLLDEIVEHLEGILIPDAGDERDAA